MMKAGDIGSLPVSRDDRLVGMVTDRDIVVRAIAEGLGGDCPISKVMSEDLKFCYDDQTVEEAANRMSDLGVRRLPVVDRQERLVGFMSLSNVASAEKPCATENLLEGTATPH
jgi:CBS domain-containing protein